MPTQEQLTTLSLAGLACLQTKYETKRNELFISNHLNHQKLSQVKYEIMSRNIHPDDNYPEERVSSFD